ncbi:hypothetical protein QU42_01680 [Bradyrhizobium sp. UASWS1016]|nr:hypothetical protein QU42_01680 [Bradyrhizobium sp. UASWS1016]
MLKTDRIQFGAIAKRCEASLMKPAKERAVWLIAGWAADSRWANAALSSAARRSIRGTAAQTRVPNRPKHAVGLAPALQTSIEIGE